ncbi:MAG: excinuclease ABC subunit UvrC [Ignavibacteria bacterium]|nr:excinuclease ABC subunit UvrC [Ignavibacteria bacterium]
MNENLIKKLENLTNKPGVYLFKNQDGKVIYVGKAKDLRKRVRQYFTPSRIKNQLYNTDKLSSMISKVQDIELISTDTEIEALLLEQNLIKRHKPKYNVNLKDDKSYPYIVITNEPFPRVFPTRNKKSDGSKYFGPYTDVKTMRYSLKILRDIFMIRTCNLPLTEEAISQKKFKICLEYHIKKCGGPCEGLVTKEEYNSMINQVSYLLNGKMTTVLKELEKEMKKKSEELKFEEAALIRDKIASLKIYTEKQKVIYETLEDIDVFAVEKIDDDACGMIFKIRDGKAVGKSHYYFSNVLNSSESEILEKFIIKYYSESDFIPDKIILPGSILRSGASKTLSEINLKTKIEFLPTLYNWINSKRNITTQKERLKIIAPTKGEDAKLVSMVKANAKLLLEELIIMKMKKYFVSPSLEALKRDLMLNEIPRRIECFDISHIQGSDMVGSMIVFQDGKPRKSEYRKYKIQDINKWRISSDKEEDNSTIPDDYAAMRQVIYRRFSKLQEEEHKDTIPNLIIIDGGKGQLNAALKVLQDLGLYSESRKVNIISLAKKLEEVYLPGQEEPFNISKSSSGLRLLQKIRDEAHRFAITFHKDLRKKRTITTELVKIKGIGKKTAEKLLKELGSVEELKRLLIESPNKVEELVGRKRMEVLKEYFSN